VTQPGAESAASARRGCTASDSAALAFTMTFPSLMSWLEFHILPGSGLEENATLKVAFGLGKVVQFAFPVVYVWLRERAWFTAGRLSRQALALGLAFGLLVGAGACAMYFPWLKHTAVFADVPARLHRWLSQFELATPIRYLGMATFISIPHSFLEEYYWRWFVFGRLERCLPTAAANVFSSLAFMSHHVFVLAFYLEGYFWSAAVPFSLCVAGGGMVWAWLYHHCRSIYPSWFSHLLVDLVLMAIGYDLMARYW
jgi:CAAX protease family protein